MGEEMEKKEKRIRMEYRFNRDGEPISLLGFGCMRFTKKGTEIDIPKAEQEVLAAIKGGVNYFDTAYIYPGSEAALGKILAKNHVREKVNIATKLPHYLIKSRKGLDRYFEEQRKRLKTDTIDYYLLHMLTDMATFWQLERLGIREWIQEKKEKGQIRHIGFSYHGNTEMFCRLVDAYPWDFCQIQYNYMDEVSQAGRAGLQYAAKKGLPVIIMEPLRGGKLVQLLPNRAKQWIARYSPKRSAAELAFRWLYEQPEVTCVLSGMNAKGMVKENVKIASTVESGRLTTKEYRLVERIKEEINRKVKVDCTGCGYCMPCPKGVDIPAAFRCYNTMYTENKQEGRREYLQCTAMRKNQSLASLCVSCGACEKRCPQHIPIRKELKNARRELETPVVALAAKGIALLKLWQ